MAENMAALPLISKEWTNYNASDPGITILENLTIFEALQGAGIGNIGTEASYKLLKMVGFKPNKGKCARLLLSAANAGRKIKIPANQKFVLGDMVFESRRATETGNHHLTGIYSYYGDEYHNLGHLYDRELKISARVFGKKPKEGDSIYFFADRLPDEGMETFFYITVDDAKARNAIDDRTENLFAALKWECYTEEGFKEIKVRDYTGAFLFSGEVRMRMPDLKAAEYADEKLPVSGYCIRATLTRANYDISPRFTAVDAFLFEVLQKDTKSVCLTFQKNNEISVSGMKENERYVLVFGKEEKGSSYRRYEMVTSGTELEGRYSVFERGPSGSFKISFDREHFGYEPERLKDAVRIVVYSEEIMRNYRIGTVRGYDDQEIELPVQHIVPESFCLIAKRVTKDGGEIFDFVRPEHDSEDALYFHLLENDGRIVIEDAGDFIGAELFMAGCAVTEGPKGNVRAGSRFEARELVSGDVFFNPGPGTGGAFKERLQDVITRFREDVNTPYTCVTAKDYEDMVMTTPGIALRKARAVMDEVENLVHIAVMPGTDEKFPVLSPIYRRAIEKRLSERRIVTTRFDILSPVYVGVTVKGTIYVKRHFTDCRAAIEGKLKELLNYPGTDRNFGEVLKFEDVFRSIEGLDCVEFIYDLSMAPEKRDKAELRDSDIYPAQNCLLYPGHLDIEMITYEQ